MSLLSSNPEFLRYARAQLRVNKFLATALICFVLSVTIAFFYMHTGGLLTNPSVAGAPLLEFAFILQALVLAGGGAIACLNSIYSEKEQNTFDYQRITRLSPTELALGKLFGAPLLMYFICLCLTPLTFYAAVIAGAHLQFVLAAFVVLFVAALAFHSFTLLLSLLSVKGSQITGIILSLLLLWFVSIDFSYGYLQLHPLGPFEAGQIANATTWLPGNFAPPYYASLFIDLFFGHHVYHLFVLLIIDSLLALFFLLGVVRNIKKDPQYYEVYSPLQFLGFALFLNFLFAAFYNPQWSNPADALSVFFTFDLIIFFLLGVALLRNRERMRSLLRTPGFTSSRLWNSLWPAPILTLGAAAAASMIVTAIHYSHPSTAPWSPGIALLRAVFFVVWLVSNLQFLQLMNLRPGKHPLVMAVLYLCIYYVCASFILGASGRFDFPARVPVTSLFVPSGIFLLGTKTWAASPTLWLAGLALQFLLIAIFIYFQHRRIQKLQPVPPS